MTDGEKSPLTLKSQLVMFYNGKAWAQKNVLRKGVEVACNIHVTHV